MWLAHSDAERSLPGIDAIALALRRSARDARAFLNGYWTPDEGAAAVRMSSGGSKVNRTGVPGIGQILLAFELHLMV
jgi:hypothetical protein